MLPGPPAPTELSKIVILRDIPPVLFPALSVAFKVSTAVSSPSVKLSATRAADNVAVLFCIVRVPVNELKLLKSPEFTPLIV